MSQSEPHSDLQQAFEQFNLVSETLNSSFHQLTETVGQFTRQLSASQEARPVDGAGLLAHQRDLLDAIPGAVVVINTGGKVTDCNDTAHELLGEPVMNALWRDIVSRVFLPQLDQGELQTEDGRQFSISTRPLGFQPGQIMLLSEVTQTRRLQRAAQQNLHLMTMGRMMASLAHQIRTPLSSAMLYLSQVVEHQADADRNARFSAKALARIQHIEQMINDMLVFAHGGQFQTAEFPASRLLAELRDQLAPHLQRIEAQLVIAPLPAEIKINGNCDALLGALANLCMNAIDARQGPLEIRIESNLSDKGWLQFIISDNGKGMTEETLTHLFDPFYTTKQDGTGLGLAVVKSVIESHQGSIEAKSEPGKGSRFELCLPSQQASRTQLSSNKHEDNNI